MTEPNEDRRIACVGADGVPGVASTLVECGDCRAPLWRSDRSIKQQPHYVPICFDCVPPGDITPAATMVQVRELADAWGSDALSVANYLSACGIEIVE